MICDSNKSQQIHITNYYIQVTTNYLDNNDLNTNFVIEIKGLDCYISFFYI